MAFAKARTPRGDGGVKHIVGTGRRARCADITDHDSDFRAAPRGARQVKSRPRELGVLGGMAEHDRERRFRVDLPDGHCRRRCPPLGLEDLRRKANDCRLMPWPVTRLEMALASAWVAAVIASRTGA